MEALLRVGVVRFREATIRAGDERVSGELRRLASRLRSAYRDLDLGSVPGVAELRALLLATGIDPSRRRSHLEGLLRRALRAQSMPSINTAVDIAHLLSMNERLPTLVHDYAGLQGDLRVRLGQDGEQFDVGDGHRAHVRGHVVVADDRGPFCDPAGGADRTRVTERTDQPVLIVFGPAGITVRRVLSVMKAAEEAFARYAGATACESMVLPAP